MISHLTEPIVKGLKNDSAYLSNDNQLVGRATTPIKPILSRFCGHFSGTAPNILYLHFLYVTY